MEWRDDEDEDGSEEDVNKVQDHVEEELEEQKCIKWEE